jgi:competence protein ComEA
MGATLRSEFLMPTPLAPPGRLLSVALTACLAAWLWSGAAQARDRGKADKLNPGETIDLNSAGFQDLVRLPGIGPSKAKAILEFRATHGAFKSLDDLDGVKGIGKSTVEKLRPYLRLEKQASGEQRAGEQAPAATETKEPAGPGKPPAPAPEPGPGAAPLKQSEDVETL